MEINDFDSVEATHEELWLKRINEGLPENYDGMLDEFGEYSDLEHPPPFHLLCANQSLLHNQNFTSSWAASILCNRSYPFLEYEQQLFDETFEMERIVSVVVPILFGIIFVVGLFGNALVVMVVASNQQMRNTTNLLILNLAVADLLFIIFCVPFTATDYVLSYWPFGATWCKMVQYIIIVTAYASVSTLVLMSADRFMAVVYPVTSISLRTDRNILLAIAVSWVVILVACAPALLAHGLEIHRYMYEDEEIQLCKFRADYNQFVFQLIFLITSYAIPLLIICLLYCTMLCRLWKSVSSSTAISNQSLRGKKRVTRMIVAVVLMFALNWLPIHVVLVLKSLHRYEMNDMTVTFQITAHVLAYMNSCVNPILYAFLSDNFRKGFRKVIQCNLGMDRVRNGLSMGASMRRRRSSAVNGNGCGNVTIAEHHAHTSQPYHGEGKEATMMVTMAGGTHCENGRRNSHRLIAIREAQGGTQEDDIL